jgi:hypothetical protein
MRLDSSLKRSTAQALNDKGLLSVRIDNGWDIF